MTQKDRDFLKQLYKSYLVVMIGTGIILSSVYLTVEYRVIYHLSLYGVLAWLILSIVLSPLFIYTFIYLYQGHEARTRAFYLV